MSSLRTMRLSQFLVGHYAAICFALLLGSMTALPQVVVTMRLGDSFHGVYPVLNDDELYYLARAEEVVDGHSRIGQPYLFEGKDRPAPQFWVPEFLTAGIAGALNIRIHTLYTSLDLILPCIAFILSYGIAFLTTRRRTVALMFAMLFHFGIYFTLFNRPISPQLNFIFLQLFFIGILRWAEQPTVRNAVIFGVISGVLLNVYAYYAIAAAMTLFFVFAICAVRRDTVRLSSLLISFSAAAPFVTLYLLQYQEGIETGYYDETMRRLGMIATHWPSGIGIISRALFAAVVLGFAFRFRFIGMSIRTAVLVALLAAIPVATNIHLVIGKNLEFSSHFSLTASFVVLLVFAAIVSSLLDDARLSQFSKKISLLSLAFVSMLTLGHAGYAAFLQSRPSLELKEEQRYGILLDWINLHTMPDTVFFSNNMLSRLIPAYTAANVYFAREANMHYVGDAEIEQRYVASKYYTSHFDVDTVLNDERSLWGTYYINRFAHDQQIGRLFHLLGIKWQSVDRFPEMEAERIARRVVAAREGPFAPLVSPYRLDGIVWDRKNDPDWEERLSGAGLTQVAVIGDFVVFTPSPATKFADKS